MTDYYLKDIKVLRLMLIIAIIGSLTLIGYSYYKSENSNDYSINIVYESGNSVYRLGQSYEYKFGVMGYNNTNEDLVYNLYAYKNTKEGIQIDDNKMIMLLKENDRVIKEPFIPYDINQGLFIGQFSIPKNSGNFSKEYEIVLGINKNINGDIIDEKLAYYSVNVKLFLVK